jgi:hypothetical protein
MRKDTEKPLWNPYVAGLFLGMVLLASFVVVGQGLGASGAIARGVVALASALWPRATAAHPYFGRYVAGGANPLTHYLVFLAVGVLLGGYLAALSGRRIRLVLERGPRITRLARSVLALAGGVLMGFAARLAYGCTSGQALSGGATLAVGSWVFKMAVFAGGYAGALFLRRAWR